jgi:uncharacterized membrane protein
MSDQWGPPPAAANIPNYLVLGIVSIFCCWPLAIVALINATKVNTLVAAGDIAGATEASAKAKKFATIAIVVGVIVNVIGLIIGLAGGLLGSVSK